MSAAIVNSHIDPETDDLIPVVEIAKARTGKRPSPATRWRWVKKGIAGGVRLEAVLISGVWFTTSAAWGAFVDAQTRHAFRDEVGNRSPGERSAETAAKLAAAGLL